MSCQRCEQAARRAAGSELVEEAARLADWIRSSGLGGAADQVEALVRESEEQRQITAEMLLEIQAEVG